LSRPRLCLDLPLAHGEPVYPLAGCAAWGCAAVDLEQRDLDALGEAGCRRLRAALRQAGLTVAAIRSRPAGELAEAFQLVGALGAEYVVAGAPRREAPAADSGHAAAWLSAAADLAETNGIPLLLENRPGTWADTGQRYDQLLRQAPWPWVGAAFDPAGFAALHEHAFLAAFLPAALKPRLRLLRIADATLEDGARVRLNTGNAEIQELVSALLARSFDGFFSVCPLGPDPAQARQAVADFRAMLAELDWEAAQSQPAPLAGRLEHHN
jgi:sugar phosphate isomerase/epimerase